MNQVKRFFIIAFLTLFSLEINGQDTLTVMQYNLLNYGVISSDCNPDNNGLSQKNAALRTITGFVNPDILGVNEMSKEQSNYQQLLDSVLNINGTNRYKRSELANASNSDLVNFVYYNSDKLSLKFQESLITGFRDINIYHFYYNNPDLSIQKDTASLVVIIAHLKAGSTSYDAEERAIEAAILMNYLNQRNKPGNYLLMGDFNLYDASESAYQSFINHSNFNLRFYDPVHKSGKWTDNEDYAMYHTQSTHNTSNNCMASSGLDDRFDFILTSYSVLSGADDFAFIPGSYRAVGQDGKHFNSSVISGTNTSAPDSVIDALYLMSDHLPVTLKMKVNKPVASVTTQSVGNMKLKVLIANRSKIQISINQDLKHESEISVIDLTGRTCKRVSLKSIIKNELIEIPTILKPGIYILKLNTNSGLSICKKVMIPLTD